MHGGGTLDANGQVWWDALASSNVCLLGFRQCYGLIWITDKPVQDVGVAGGSSRTFARPVPLTIGNATNVVVEDILQIGSPNWVRYILSFNLGPADKM